ncbi:MAG: UDP-glucose/GDP-mannose dehydrogenase family protein [Candidatus Peribacteraceae bacterium]|nr:UDP-glucose/GDP-mannose dehydrogenase family protein [Candidatus Peribacteraceae bacterium]
MKKPDIFMTQSLHWPHVKIAIIGTGYVGLVSAACFAELGHEVIGVDIDEAKVKKLKAGQSPIYEPGLEELLIRNLQSGRLSFTTELNEALPTVSVLFCAVATPPNKDYTADLRAVFAVCDSVAENIDHDLVFVNKSTVPVGTGKECEKRIHAILGKRNIRIQIPVISNPEFLREGTAVQDTLHPDRIVVGANGDEYAKKAMEELYAPLVRTEKPLVFMTRESAEIVKYASNSFLATKISFINMLTELCEVTGGSIRDVAKGMGLDERIGPRFLHAGIGYGGSCFPKDVKALMAVGKKHNVPMPIVKATHDVNDRQRERFFQMLVNTLPEKATIGVWGLAFKPNTDDMREAPSLDLLPMLVETGHTVRVFDPVAMENSKKIFPKEVEYMNTPMEAAKEADAVILLTEWDVFRGIDLKELKAQMRGRALFDGRNVFLPDEVRGAGLQYFGIGVK